MTNTLVIITNISIILIWLSLLVVFLILGTKTIPVYTIIGPIIVICCLAISNIGLILTNDALRKIIINKSN